MRQVGILCAAALVALHENVANLDTDHKRAKILVGIFPVYLILYTKLLFGGQPLPSLLKLYSWIFFYFLLINSEGLNQIKEFVETLIYHHIHMFAYLQLPSLVAQIYASFLCECCSEL